MREPPGDVHRLHTCTHHRRHRREDFARRPTSDGAVIYHRVILGFVREGADSRWLTHSEISDGVLEAIEADQPEYVGGKVRPWEERP